MTSSGKWWRLEVIISGCQESPQPGRGIAGLIPWSSRLGKCTIMGGCQVPCCQQVKLRAAGGGRQSDRGGF